MKKKDLYLIGLISVVFVLFLVIIDYYVVFLPEIEEDQVADTVVHKIPVKEEFGFSLGEYSVQKQSVRNNEFFADILVNKGIDYAIVDQLLKNGAGKFDARRIKAGNTYAFVNSRDSLPEKYFIYQENAVDYIVFQLFDSLKVERKQKEKLVISQQSSGVITSSLWNSMVGQGLDPNLVVSLADIYAWTIDFFGIQEGDSYYLYYDESFVDSVSIGAGKIHAALFIHEGKEYWAIGFEQDGTFAYFDDKGLSLRKAFLKAPLKYSRISSKFTNSRYHPVLKIRRPHHGVDYAAPSGTPVYTIGDGKVIDKGYQRAGGGNFVKIKHNSVYTTMYMHLKGFAQGLSVGDHVSQGELIGYVGSTGLSTGPHLDFRVYQNGKPVDPLKMESPPVDPIHKANEATFNGLIRHWKEIIIPEKK